MSYMLPHLRSGWAVDQAILNEESKVVVIRFGHDENETCMQMDEVLYKISEDVRNFAAIYLVDTTEVSRALPPPSLPKKPPARNKA
jgi:DIM1 family U5 snRNP protein